MIFTGYWEVLVLNFSVMGNTVFFFSQKVDGKMIFTWSFGAFYDVPGPGEYGFSRSVTYYHYHYYYQVFSSFLYQFINSFLPAIIPRNVSICALLDKVSSNFARRLIVWPYCFNSSFIALNAFTLIVFIMSMYNIHRRFEIGILIFRLGLPYFTSF